MNTSRWEQIKEIFNAASELPEAEREGFLVRECESDSELLEEMRSLFGAFNEYDGSIDAPVFRSVSSFVDAGNGNTYVGKLAGAYRIESELGRGGMGTVYLASRADSEFDKKVAVKLIKRGYDTDEIVKRFRYERQILAALEHPNITRLLDGGSTEDGLPFLVMDYVDGVPLKEYCDREQLSIRKRLELFLNICSAVAYAHQNLVIHRDLKPSNILVLPDGTPKLLDFGIAKLTDASEGTQPTIGTGTATRAMTPDYASPEQISGQAVTTTTDVYSLGVILYELLTGHKPYRFKNHNPDEITRILWSSTILRPSSACRLHGLRAVAGETASVIRQLHGDLDKIVFMAMRLETDRRYSSVEQFADDIRRHLNGLPVMAQEDSISYRVSKYINRNKPGVAAGLGIAASLIGGLIVARRQARNASRQRDRAERANLFLQKMLAAADPRKSGKELQAAEMLKIAGEKIGTEFAAQPEIASNLNATLGLTYLSLGRIEDAGEHLRAALDVRLEHFPRQSIAVARSLHDYGKFLHAKGDLRGAEPYYREALRIFERDGRHELDIAEVLANLGYLAGLMGNSESAIDLHRRELDIKRTLHGEDNADVARAMSRLASVLSLIGRDDVAEPYQQRALEILRGIYGEEHPDIALVMNDMVRTVVPTDPERGERLCRAALDMRRRLLDEDHSDVAWSLYNLAYVLIERGRIDDAEIVVEEALAKRGANLPEEHPIISSCLLLRGQIAMARAQYSRAQETFRACLELRKRTLPSDHWLIAAAQSYLGECMVRLGERAAGEQLLHTSRDFLRQRLGSEHVLTRQADARMRRALNLNSETATTFG